MNAYPLDLHSLTQAHLDWLVGKGVASADIVNPTSVWWTRGSRHDDGRFDPDPAGRAWFAFEEPDDWVFWRLRTGEIALDEGRSFALGGEWIDNPGTCALDGRLTLFADPLHWLQNKRRGVVVLDWRRAFERLRWVTRVTVAEPLYSTYRKHMKPSRMPEVAVLPMAKSMAAA